MHHLATKPTANARSRKRRGNVLIELSLICPWVLFLFVGIVDLGFFSYALIAVENATRIAAEYTSSSTLTAADQSGACTKVLAELQNLPNVSSLTSCGATPLTVTVTSGNGPDGNAASTVSVTYQSISMIPIPGILQNQLNVTRIAQMRVKP